MHPEPERSSIGISFVNNRSVLVTSRVFRPLKIFALYQDPVCHIVFSNYGGGFVEGDQVLVDIDCGQDTTSIFSNQANTRIYKSEEGKSSRQEIKGSVGASAFTVMLGDPVVPHTGSMFEQAASWSIGKDSVLLVIDWFEAGRLLNGERFDFHSFSSTLKVESDGIPLVWDQFRMDPLHSNLNSPGAFFDHSGYLNVFLVGQEQLPKVQLLERCLRDISSKYFMEENPAPLPQASLMGASVRISEKAFVTRCSAKSHEIIAAMVKEITHALANPGLLGFDPGERKF